MFGKMGIKSKLILAFTIAALVPVVVGGVSYHYSTNVISTYRSIAKDNVPNFKLFIEMKALMATSQIPVAALVGTPSTPEDAAKGKADFDKTINEFDKFAKDYESTPFADGEEAFWKDFKNNSFIPYVNMSLDMIKLSGTNNKADQKTRDNMYDHDYAEAIKKRNDSFAKLVSFQLEDAEKKEKSGDQSNAQMNTLIMIIVVLGFVVALAFGYLISTTLSRELLSVAGVLNGGTEQVSASVTQLAGAAEELSSSSVEQAASVQETASSVEEISAMVRKNSANAIECERVSASSKEKAENGKNAVDRMVQSMGEISRSNETIQAQIEQSNKKLGDVIHVIQEIGNKTKVINDIVFQTKLLSFNASVEAARAGEHGKGFAVVAEEVGNLAQMSGNSAKEISTLLEESLKKVETMITETTQSVGSLMTQSKQTVENGNKTAEDCGRTLEAIVGDVKKLSDLISEISGAGREQSQGIDEISKAIQQIDLATQANSSAAQQTSSSSHNLSLQVSQLQSAASRLKAVVQGGDAQSLVSASVVGTRPHAVAKVIEIKKNKSTFAASARPIQKKVASSDIAIPKGDDPRFDDV